MSIAKQIKHLRIKRGLTQKQLADLMGTKAQVISAWEQDDYSAYTLSTLSRLVTALNAKLNITIVDLDKS